ncbi:MAG: tRNA lysidine(34) synthetase TilS [Myxococcota bacterium]|nr:tRNA lysidine(34) synthetase TilS [Myxococcota bacterium]
MDDLGLPAGPSHLERRVLAQIRTAGLWAADQVVVVAVSGGLDSVVLLDVLHRTAGGHGGRLRVASCDHGLRPESAAEVRDVGTLAAQLGLPFTPLRLDVAAGPDLASRCRNARRAALRGLGADRIATGHHQDDQAETVLHHLLRGSGLHGLQGMRALAPPFCRPLLDEPRSALRAYARERSLAWVEDPSNPASLRGRIRAVMPSLDSLHGGAGRALARSAGLLARDAAHLEALTEAAWGRAFAAGGLSLSIFRREPEALQARMLRRLLRPVGPRLRAAHIEQALRWVRRPQGRLGLPGGRALSAQDGLLYLEEPA